MNDSMHIDSTTQMKWANSLKDRDHWNLIKNKLISKSFYILSIKFFVKNTSKENTSKENEFAGEFYQTFKE